MKRKAWTDCQSKNTFKNEHLSPAKLRALETAFYTSSLSIVGAVYQSNPTWYIPVGIKGPQPRRVSVAASVVSEISKDLSSLTDGLSEGSWGDD